jgi:RNA polymerase sigma-70 factor (ECF subfamily)
MSSDREHPASGDSLSRLPSRELLRRAREGDRDAVDRLFARVIPLLQRWAHRRVPGWARNAADTGDLVQETVLNTMRHLGSFEPQRDGALLRYLRRSLINRVHDQFRHAARHPAPLELDDVHVDLAASPLEFTIDRQNRKRYVAALKQLKAADRTAIIGRMELGYSYEQLALVLNKATPGAARLAVRRALLRLAQEMRGA